MFFQQKSRKFFFSTVWMYVFAETLADGAAVFVIHHAARLVEHLPAALPGQVAEVGVFQVKGRQQLVEAAELEELAPVEGARAAAAVEARKEAVDAPGRCDGARAGRHPATSLASARFLRAACRDR